MPLKKVIGFDIGGTKIFGARFDVSGKIEAKLELKTEAEQGKKAVLQKITDAIAKLKTPEVRTVGIAWPGLVQSASGTVIRTPNIPDFANVALAEILQKKCHLPVFLENDSHLFTLAEAQVGAGKGLPYVLGLIFGTGVGSGLVLNGRMFGGHDGFAGEIGHTLSSFDDQTEIEQVFSGPGLQRFLQKRGFSRDLQEISGLLSKNSRTIDSALSEWGKLLAEMLANLVILLNPSIIVLGGSISRHILKPLLPWIHQNTEAILQAKDIPSSLRLNISELENAGALGAALLAQEKLKPS